VLPEVERIPPATYRKLEEFARNGGTLIATRRTPSLAPGLADAEQQGREVSDISRRLFEGPPAQGRIVADPAKQIAPAIAARLAPDMAVSPATPDIGFIRRGTDSAQIYFIANTGNEKRAARATFRVEGREAAWWDPMTGEATPARTASRPAGGTAIDISLEPYESRVLVFSRENTAAPKPRGAVAKSFATVDLSSGWTVSFTGVKAAVSMPALRSWTDDAATRFYSGEAVYEKTVTLSETAPSLFLDFGEGKAVASVEQKQPGMRAFLDPPVREAAVVYVNGKRAGSVWRPPYRLAVGAFLKPGANAIRIVVANTAINSLAGRPAHDYSDVHKRYGPRFAPQDMDHLQPVPSGLLGRITLAAR
jgi:hypothetical protein